MLKSILIVIAFSLSGFALMANNDAVPEMDTSGAWISYADTNGVLIEYQYVRCDTREVNNQALYIFRFTNQSEAPRTLSWQMKIYRDGECTNCHRINRDEYTNRIELNPDEVVEGNCETKVDKRMYVFSHFIKLVPGMSGQQLTKFEFTNLEVK